MAVNSDKPHLWKPDIAASVDLYNDWFIRFAPDAYRQHDFARRSRFARPWNGRRI